VPGGVAGLAVAALCHRGLLALVGDRIPIPRLDQMALDLPVIAFAMVIALATGLVFGVVPAFVTTSHSSDALREGGRHGGGRRLHGALRVLVVAELRYRSYARWRRPVDAQLRQAAERRPRLRAEGACSRRACSFPTTRYDLVRPAASSANLCRILRRCRRSACCGVFVPAGSVPVHRHELLACRSAKAGGWTAVIQPGAADHAGILQDTGNPTGGQT
jgi:hypothetical protein